MPPTDKRKYKVIITGATGMVGEGVAYECLQSAAIESVLLVSRRPTTLQHAKLREIVHADFFQLEPIAQQLMGFDACFFCLGTTSLGKAEPLYTKTTYDLTMHFAETLVQVSPGATFCYISGAGTDGTEKGRIMWARVKGKTENALGKLGFAAVYLFRPGVLEPTPGLKNTLSYYHYLGWLLPLIRRIAPKYISSLKQLGKAMIATLTNGYPQKILEVPDIKKLAARYDANG